jgi:hypothetical protein
VTDHLHDAIDKAGQDMLERCAREVDGRPIPMSQQVECFVALIKWAEVREKIKPPPPPVEKGETEFERIQREFSGKRRGRPRKPTDDGAAERAGATDGPAEGDGEPAPPADAANGAAAAEHSAAGSSAADEPYLDGGRTE